MPCEPFITRDGASGFICSRGSRSRAKCSVDGCTKPSTKLCDFPLTGKKAGKTCDRKLCDAHAKRQPVTTLDPSDTVDFCPTHDAMRQLEAARQR